jgi:ferredoxin
MYPEFTVHASGENPRKDRGDRIRNRMLHKFSFYPQNLGHIACVGCGRCIEMCPVNEDLIEILNKVRDVVNE